MKKLVVLSLIASLALTNFVYADKPADKFTDVGVTHWAYNTINELAGKGIITGYPDSTFKPSGTITTAEFLKIVASLDGKEIEKTGNHWASGYIDYAKEKGYFPDGMFSEADFDKPITREKMAVVMAIVAGKKDSEAENAKVTAENQKKLETAVKDYSSICNYCKENISKAMLKGIISGYPDGTFKPQNTANRAEASSMILRLMNPSDRKPFDLRTESEKLDAHVTQKGDILSLNLPKKTLSILADDNEAYIKRVGYTYKMFDDPSIFQMKYAGVEKTGDKGSVFNPYRDTYRVQMKINSHNVWLLDKDYNVVGQGGGIYGKLSDWGFSTLDPNPLDWNNPKKYKNPTSPEAKYFAWYEGSGDDDVVYIVPNTLSYK